MKVERCESTLLSIGIRVAKAILIPLTAISTSCDFSICTFVFFFFFNLKMFYIFFKIRNTTQLNTNILQI